MTGKSTSEDQELRDLMRELDPSPQQVDRMEEKMVEWLHRDDPMESLFAEWVELLRVKPIAVPALAFTSCVGLLLLSPISGVLLTLLGG